MNNVNHIVLKRQHFSNRTQQPNIKFIYQFVTESREACVIANWTYVSCMLLKFISILLKIQTSRKIFFLYTAINNVESEHDKSRVTTRNLFAKFYDATSANVTTTQQQRQMPVTREIVTPQQHHQFHSTDKIYNNLKLVIKNSSIMSIQFSIETNKWLFNQENINLNWISIKWLFNYE